MRPGGVVLRAVAGAEPAAELAARIGRLLAERNAAEMGADADQISHSGFLDALAHRSADRAGRRRSTASRRLDLLRRAVATKTGLPRHITVIALADLDRARGRPRSVDSASTSAAGFIWSMNGQATAAAPTAPTRAGREHQEIAPRPAVVRRAAAGAPPSAMCVIPSAPHSGDRRRQDPTARHAPNPRAHATSAA